MVRCGGAVLRKVSAGGPGSGGDGPWVGWGGAGRAGGQRRLHSRPRGLAVHRLCPWGSAGRAVRGGCREGNVRYFSC